MLGHALQRRFGGLAMACPSRLDNPSIEKASGYEHPFAMQSNNTLNEDPPNGKRFIAQSETPSSLRATARQSLDADPQYRAVRLRRSRDRTTAAGRACRLGHAAGCPGLMNVAST